MSRAQALSAGKWAMVGQFTTLAIKMVSVWVMSKLLDPTTFGVSTLMFTVLVGFQMLSEIGVRTSVLISRRGLEPAFLNTAWSIQVIRGAAVFAAGCASSWPLALWMERPEMTWVMPCLSLTALLDGFVSTRLHVATRLMQFRAATIVPMVGETVGAAVRIGVALAWPSVMSIVLGAIASSSAIVLMSHFLMQGHRNTFKIDVGARREIMRVGKWIAASTALVFVGMQADRLILAGMIPLAALGVYNLTLLIANVPSDFLSRFMASYAQPRLVQLAEHRDRLRLELHEMRRVMLAAGGLGCSLMVTLGPAMMQVLFDERYADSIWMIQAIGFATWLRIVGHFNAMAVMAVGRAKANTISNFVKALGLCTLLPLAALEESPELRFVHCIAAVVLCDILKTATDVWNAARIGLGGAGFDSAATLKVFASAGTSHACGVMGCGPVGSASAGCVAALILWARDIRHAVHVITHNRGTAEAAKPAR